MKKFVRALSLFLVLSMMLAVFVSCKKENSDNDTDTQGNSNTETQKPRPQATINITEGKKCNYTLVRPSDAGKEIRKLSIDLKNTIEEKIGGSVAIKEDFLYGDLKPEEFEILIGQTNRDESKKVLEDMKYLDYTICIENKKLVINAKSDEALKNAINHMINYIKESQGNITFSTENEVFAKADYKVDKAEFEGKDLNGYTIILSNFAPPAVKDYTNLFRDKLVKLSGVYLDVKTDLSDETEKEILIGETKRKQSKKIDASSLGKNGYAIKAVDEKIVIKTNDDDYTYVALANMCLDKIEKDGSLEQMEGTVTVSDKPIAKYFCFTDVHNNWAMLEPPYQVRKNVTTAIDTMLRDYGKMDIVFVGGDLMSDYPNWNASGWLPYEFYLGYKEKLVEEFARFAKDEKVHYTAGNHDYGQGEIYKPDYNDHVNGGGPGPGKGGSYNSYEFYFTGPMDKTFGVIPEENMCYKISTHTNEKYLLAFYYEVGEVGVFGLAPDPDLIWYNQAQGFSPESLVWLKNKLDEVDPYGNKVMFLNCHYVINNRYLWNNEKKEKVFPLYGVDMRKDGMDVGAIKDFGGDAPELAGVLKGHKNLFHLFGHAETWMHGYTSTAIFHYNKSGNLMPFDTFKRDNSYGVANYATRGFNGVYMGHFRPAGEYSTEQGWPVSWFDKDTVKGYAGSYRKWAQASTGTPKISQGMYIELYEDRVVFSMKNFGVFDGWRYEDENVSYTHWLYK